MGQTTQAQAKPEPKAESKPKRKVLTEEQRIAKLEAEIKERRAKVAERTARKVNEAQAKRRNLVDQIEFMVETRLRPVEAELVALGETVTPFEVKAPTNGPEPKG